MKIRVKLWHFLLLVVLSIAIPVIAQTAAPDTCKSNHTRSDFRKSVRVAFPVTVTEVLGNRLNYMISDEGIELGSFELEPGYSIVPKDFVATNAKGCYFIHYCEKHLVVLQIDVLPDKACGLSKN